MQWRCMITVDVILENYASVPSRDLRAHGASASQRSAEPDWFVVLFHSRWQDAWQVELGHGGAGGVFAGAGGARRAEAAGACSHALEAGFVTNLSRSAAVLMTNLCNTVVNFAPDCLRACLPLERQFPAAHCAGRGRGSPHLGLGLLH
jgi:hypothetical protein